MSYERTRFGQTCSPSRVAHVRTVLGARLRPRRKDSYLTADMCLVYVRLIKRGGFRRGPATLGVSTVRTDHVAGPPLTEEQRRLVRENIGLVTVHLRRHVANLSTPRRDREWEDLFQEGCLGLIKAAVRYRRERGIPFAAFALPRIHNAVSRALQRKFSTVYVPPKRTSRRGGSSTSSDPSDPRVVPKTYSLSDELESRLADKRRHDPDGGDRETIGQRLRGKYDRALRAAGKALCAKTSTRGDRDKLVRLLTEERFLVPHDEAKRPLRQIARDTRSSYARVAQCDKQLREAIRTTLQSDPEFVELNRRIRAEPFGADLPIDLELECELARASTEELVRRFLDANDADRARMLDVILKMSQSDIQDIIRLRFMRLSPRMRERLLRDLAQPCKGRN